MVASVAAGTLDKTEYTPMHGVAFDADILFVAIQLSRARSKIMIPLIW